MYGEIEWGGEFAVVAVDFVGMCVTQRVIHISIKINIEYILCRY